MSKLSIDENEGFLTIEVKAGTPPQPVEIRLDLFEANNVYAGICDSHENAVERAEAWIEWLLSKGLPRLSHGAAYRLADNLLTEVAEFKKKGPAPSSQTPGSPSSTASPVGV